MSRHETAFWRTGIPIRQGVWSNIDSVLNLSATHINSPKASRKMSDPMDRVESYQPSRNDTKMQIQLYRNESAI